MPLLIRWTKITVMEMNYFFLVQRQTFLFNRSFNLMVGMRDLLRGYSEYYHKNYLWFPLFGAKTFLCSPWLNGTWISFLRLALELHMIYLCEGGWKRQVRSFTLFTNILNIIGPSIDIMWYLRFFRNRS